MTTKEIFSWACAQRTTRRGGASLSRPFFWMIVGAGILVCLSARAQQSSPPEISKVSPPAPPLVKPPPNPASWIIHVQGGQAQGKGTNGQPKVLKETDVVEADGIRKESNTWSDGSTSDAWYDAGLRLALERGQVYSENLAQSYPDKYPELKNVDLSKTSFIEIAWVGVGNFVGQTNLSGRPCYYFRFGAQEAWIDVETRLPVASKWQGETRTYQFGPAPSGPLELPPLLKQEFERYTRALHDADRYKMKP